VEQHSRAEKIEALGRVIDVLDTLRVKCPWDAKQTNESLRPNTVEEVYELCDALINGNNDEIKKELGDVLLHVLFYSKIGEEKGDFDIVSVCDALANKLIYRHPHVYGQVAADTAHQVELNWEQLKLREKDGNKSILAGVPGALPALIKAYRIQEKAANAGFDWEQPADVWAKVKEEIGEFADEAAQFQGKDAVDEENHNRMEAEMGDLFFSLINAARLYGLHPENALERTNKKFIKRFNHIEPEARQQGKSLKDMTLDEMEQLWNEAKHL
jgi:XTP/dITP diphosphohydrolase